ncbi:MAG: EpsD family peptidyl-prolyl cis-trans isomerase [Aquabacterium sp.]
MAQPTSSPGFRMTSVTVVALAATLALLSGCGDKKKEEKKASQTAARVNKEELTVHQINFILQQQRGLRPEQADAASRQVLERLIDQQVAMSKVEELKLDRDAKVLQQLDAAKRDIMYRAYIERVGEAAPKPTPEEIKKYYSEKPALFSERRVFSLQELAIEAKPEQLETLRGKLAAAKNIAEFIEYLKANDFRFSGNQAVRAAEQLPLASLDTISKLKDGQALINPTPNGATVLVLAGSRNQPVDLERATPAIEQFLLNERKRELITKDIKELRAAAKIEYVGKFAASAPTAGSATGATTAAPAAAAAPASGGGLDASAINKGMGIKK